MVHPEYADIGHWPGPETADIVYLDKQSVLTELLIDKGYLAQDQWRGLEPEYYIEVKSTTGACDTRFYMSKNQYQRVRIAVLHFCFILTLLQMKDTSNGASGSINQGRIYVVCRVFNLYKDSIGVQVYMDPDVMRRRGDLIFAADGWTVVPAPAPN